MRTIKFRGKRTDGKGWAFGHFMQSRLNDVDFYIVANILTAEFVRVTPETVGQFTGLTNKNGVEIYEGDILEWTSSNPFSLGEIRRVKVIYIESHYWCYNARIGVYLAEILSNENCEVIGNIHENPGMIKL